MLQIVVVVMFHICAESDSLTKRFVVLRHNSNRKSLGELKWTLRLKHSLKRKEIRKNKKKRTWDKKLQGDYRE